MSDEAHDPDNLDGIFAAIAMERERIAQWLDDRAERHLAEGRQIRCNEVERIAARLRKLNNTVLPGTNEPLSPETE